MYRKLADTIILDFTVHAPTIGAVSDADALPTVEIWEDETDTTLAGGTVTKRVGKTGNYRVAVAATTANGFEVGKSYNVVVTVIAEGITAKAVVGSFSIDGKRLSDLQDISAPDLSNLDAAVSTRAPEAGGNVAAILEDTAEIGTAGVGLTALGDTRLANLDAAVSTRSTLTAQNVWEYATRTLSSFGTLIADLWVYATRSLTDKAGFSISGIKTTLDDLNDAPAPDLSNLALEANVQGYVTAALNAYDPPTKGEMDTAIAGIVIPPVDLTALTNLVTRALGLAGENMVMDQTVFDADKKLTSARVRIYDSAAHALAAGDTGVIGTFPLTMTWAAKLLETMTQVIS
jgi:hypothetical protein